MGRSISFDRVAEQYDATRGGEPRGRAHADRLTEDLPTRGTILEIGVGTGLVASALRENGYAVVGIDLSMPMLLRARDRVGDRVAIGDAERLPIADSSVAAAYSVWVLHLVGDREQVLREARRVVAPGGCYVVIGSGRGAAPDDEIGAVWWRMRRGVRGGDEPDEPGALADSARRAGWRVEAATEWAQEEYAETPRETVRRVRERTWAWLWDIDDATWQEVVEPELQALAGRPGQDEPRLRRSYEHVLVLR